MSARFCLCKNSGLHSFVVNESQIPNRRDDVLKLVFSCRAWLLLGSNIIEVSAESQSRIKETVEQLTGLSVAQVNINFRHKSAGFRRLPAC